MPASTAAPPPLARSLRRPAVRPPLRRSTGLTERITKEDAPSRGQATVIWVHRLGLPPVAHTLTGIAHGTGLSVSGVALVMGGRRTGRLETLKRIAKQLNVSLDLLSQFLATQRPDGR